VNSVDQTVVVLDLGFRVTSWNPAAERLWGIAAADTVGRDFFALPIGAVTTEASQAIRRVQAGASASTGMDVTFTTSGSERRSVLRLLPLHDGQPQIVGVVGLVLSRERSDLQPSRGTVMEHGRQVLEADGLHQVGVEAGVPAMSSITGLTVSGERDQLHPAPQCRPDPLRHLVATGTG
jgi:PAS domain S-box-containing protein